MKRENCSSRDEKRYFRSLNARGGFFSPSFFSGDVKAHSFSFFFCQLLCFWFSFVSLGDALKNFFGTLSREGFVFKRLFVLFLQSKKKIRFSSHALWQHPRTYCLYCFCAFTSFAVGLRAVKRQNSLFQDSVFFFFPPPAFFCLFLCSPHPEPAGLNSGIFYSKMLTLDKTSLFGSTHTPPSSPFVSVPI